MSELAWPPEVMHELAWTDLAHGLGATVRPGRWDMLPNTSAVNFLNLLLSWETRILRPDISLQHDNLTKTERRTIT